ncbi:hypothetical protein JAAARDRAFT_338167 [Jaapia argillacea MUCL 33604]|uniref:Uncharacterized protein n=1 Tax=Jaapia argillacea MUCL 33604 TaxID=933084 RepID=A0A067PNV8_9AGAM|nr:hypothetical protein JAAARDRAFT_338167 [Jaapia argillacea MUCL 33604]
MGPLTDSQVLNHTPHSSHHHAAPIPYPPGLGYGSSMHNDHLSLLGYPAMPPHQGMSNPPMAMPRPMYPKAIPPSSSMNIRGGRTSVANPRRPLPTPHNPEPQHPVASTSATPSHPYPFNPQIPRDLPRYPPPPGPPPGYPFHNGQGGHTNVVNPRGLLQAPHNPEPQHPVASTSATPSYPHPVNPQIPRDLPRYSPPPGPPPGYPFHNGPVPELAPQPGGSNEGQDAALLVPVTLIKSKGTKRRHNETDEEKQFTEFIEFAQSLVRTWKAQFVRDMPCPLPGCNVVLTTDLSKEDWREHIKEHGLGQHTLIQCPLCLLDPDVTPPILQAMSLGEHLKLEMHYDSHRVKCPVCLRTESRIDSLKRHMRTPGCHADPNNQHRADKLKAMMRRPDALILRQDIVNLYS